MSPNLNLGVLVQFSQVVLNLYIYQNHCIYKIESRKFTLVSILGYTLLRI